MIFSEILDPLRGKKFVIAKDKLNKKGTVVKEFYGFNSHLGVKQFYEAQGEKCFHEVLKGEYRKLYFDYDLKLEDGETHTHEFVSQITAILPVVVNRLFGVKIGADDILICESNRPGKESYHVIVPKFACSVRDMKFLFKFMAKMIPNLDSQVYSSTKCFRMIGSHKMGQPECTKKYFTTSFSFYDTLISHIEDSQIIELTAEFSGIAKTKVKAPVESTIDKAEIYSMVMKLNKSRADNFGDWRKICLILGHEGAGLQTAIDFSKQSRSYDESQTIKLYETGRSNTVANPATIGTLIHMLKQDCPNWRPMPVEPSKKEFCVEESTEEEPALEKVNIANVHPEEDEMSYEETAKLLESKGCDCGKDCEFCRLPYVGFDISEDLSNYCDAVMDKKFKELEEQFKPKPKKLTGEEKIKKWLANPERSFYYKSRNPRAVLTNRDVLEIYKEKHMRDYGRAKTMFIKAEKGTGKTYALIKQLEKRLEANPDLIVGIVAFRRTLSDDLLKRFGKLNFIDYRDIKTKQIDTNNKRVIIQVESLPRLNWGVKPDILICDEIESIRNQFFSQTCSRDRNACISKFEMLVSSAGELICMDADLSSHTVNLIRPHRSGAVTYIENMYQEIQAGFTDFYTTDENTAHSQLYGALLRNEKVVIPTNKSKEWMEALKVDLLKKFPNKRIAVFNSKTKLNANIANEIKNPELWKAYDCVIYSPTISAGVSIEYEYFDKCFCYFVNSAGKVNSLRQMINRVRKFKTNEFYFHLKIVGGRSGPTDVEGMEAYIRSNRFIEIPENVAYREKYDGTREYPYKNLAYWMWIYDQIERNEDSSMFLYSFLRAQYHAGVGTMKLMLPASESKLEEKEINRIKKNLQAEKCDAIAQAPTITEAEAETIKEKKNKEEKLSDVEYDSLTRHNLCKYYKLPDCDIDGRFVKEYSRSAVREGFKNRALLERGLDELKRNEDGQFNALFTDNSNVSDDLDYKYKYKRLKIVTEFLEIIGFAGYEDEGELTRETIKENFARAKDKLEKDMPGICTVFKMRPRDKPDVDKWTFKNQLKFMNSKIEQMLQVDIKQTGHKSNKYKIRGLGLYDFEFESPRSIQPAVAESNEEISPEITTCKMLTSGISGISPETRAYFEIS